MQRLYWDDSADTEATMAKRKRYLQQRTFEKNLTGTTVEKLPVEVLAVVARQMSIKERTSFGQVSKLFHNAAHSVNAWKDLKELAIYERALTPLDSSTIRAKYDQKYDFVENYGDGTLTSVVYNLHNGLQMLEMFPHRQLTKMVLQIETASSTELQFGASDHQWTSVRDLELEFSRRLNRQAEADWDELHQMESPMYYELDNLALVLHKFPNTERLHLKAFRFADTCWIPALEKLAAMNSIKELTVQRECGQRPTDEILGGTAKVTAALQGKQLRKLNLQAWALSTKAMHDILNTQKELTTAHIYHEVDIREMTEGLSQEHLDSLKELTMQSPTADSLLADIRAVLSSYSHLETIHITEPSSIEHILFPLAMHFFGPRHVALTPSVEVFGEFWCNVTMQAGLANVKTYCDDHGITCDYEHEDDEWYRIHLSNNNKTVAIALNSHF